MTDFEAYQEYIQRKHNAFCKAVIRYAARDKILQLRRKWERQISLDYLMTRSLSSLPGRSRTRNTPLPSAARPSCSVTPLLPPRSPPSQSRHRK